MPEFDLAFDYVAIDGDGRRTRGRLTAPSEVRAYEALKRAGLSPIKLAARRGASSQDGKTAGRLRDTDLEALFPDLGALLQAGADIRSALAILGRRSDRPALSKACQALAASIGGGASMESGIAALVGKGREVLPAMIAAGEAGGDLAGGFKRGAALLASRRAIREQLISALSYPAFVLVSTLGAIILIVFFVIPSLEPLVKDTGSAPPPVLLVNLIAISQALSSHGLLIGAAAALIALGLGILQQLGALDRPLQRAALDGPAGRTATSLVYGAFAASLGGMLAAGASMADALRLAIRTVGWQEARDRLTPVLTSVRQGETLSAALDQVEGFPAAIARLAAVGEATGALGPMLARSGTYEEAQALKRIEAGARLLGPLLIVVLGGLIGLLMAALLSGLTGLGDSALQ